MLKIRIVFLRFRCPARRSDLSPLSENSRIAGRSLCFDQAFGRFAPDDLPLDELRDFVEAQLETEIWQEEQRFENPHCHFVDMSPEYYSLKMGLLNDDQLRHGENAQS